MAVVGRNGIIKLSKNVISTGSPPIITSSPFLIQAQIVDWSLNLTNSEIDTTSLGEEFGDAIKTGVVSGGGSLNFLVERTISNTVSEDSTILMNLLLSSGIGSKASAEFWMIRNRPEDNCGILEKGSLYYTTDILITNSVINTTVDRLINGTIEFVTVGEIQLCTSST